MVKKVVKKGGKSPGRTEPISFWIDGAPFSKANSRRIVFVKGKGGRGRVKSIKSDKALSYSDDFIKQCPVLNPLFLGDVHLDLDIYYPDRRRDLDESLVLDLMQGRIYANDRQVRSRMCRWNISKDKPGVMCHVRLMGPEDYAGGASNEG